MPSKWATCALDEQQQSALASAITIASERTFEQDPRFGICVLTEVAQRALSPAVNDPGTAIDIITRHTRVLAPWKDLDSYTDEGVHCPQVRIHPLNIDDLLADEFFPIARDAGETLEVHIRLHKALHALAAQESVELRAAAIRCAQTCYLFAEQNLQLEQQKEMVKHLMLQPE